MRRIDSILSFSLFILVLFGLVMLSSATALKGFSEHQDSYYFLKRQLTLGVFPGLFVFFATLFIDYRFWKRVAPFLFLLAILFLLLVFIPGLGVSHGRTQSWLQLGGIVFQPAEFVKLAFIFFLALWLDREKDVRHDDTLAGTFWPFAVRLGVIGGLVALQPDVGTFFIIALIACVMYFVAGAPWRYLLFIGGAGVAAFATLILAAPYRIARVLVFLNPSTDTQGVGYHLNQAIIAIGSGKLFGVGLGQSRQKFQYLPEVAGDSIFAVIAEEGGFFVSLFLVAIFLVILFRALRIAARAPDPFGQYVAIGIVTWFVGQAFLNIGAMLGVFPLTGLPLPFVSYGGTSMVMTLAAAGILLNISKNQKRGRS